MFVHNFIQGADKTQAGTEHPVQQMRRSAKPPGEYYGNETNGQQGRTRLSIVIKNEASFYIHKIYVAITPNFSALINAV